MNNKIYKLALVGATGLVGRTALKVLEEKNFPNFEYKLFCSKKICRYSNKIFKKRLYYRRINHKLF